jgi:hypothetical protein
MELFFGFVLLVLAGGMVVLFAMMGELATRVERVTPRIGRDTSVVPLKDADIGGTPVEWPEPLAPVALSGRPAALMVLSTSCLSCEDVARQLAEESRSGPVSDVGVVVSCPDAMIGRDFVVRHQIEEIPHFVDEGGNWIKETFGVSLSPSAVVVQDGRATSALQFWDVAALRAAALTHEEVT